MKYGFVILGLSAMLLASCSNEPIEENSKVKITDYSTEELENDVYIEYVLIEEKDAKVVYNGLSKTETENQYKLHFSYENDSVDKQYNIQLHGLFDQKDNMVSKFHTSFGMNQESEGNHSITITSEELLDIDNVKIKVEYENLTDGIILFDGYIDLPKN